METTTFKPIICQQPKIGKICGSLEEPRYSLLYWSSLSRYPRLILSIDIGSQHPCGDQPISLGYGNIVCNLTLVDSLTLADYSAVDSSTKSVRPNKDGIKPLMSKYLRPMAGSTSAVGTLYEEARPASTRMYFIFPGLSIRVDGRFRLKCSFIDMNTQVGQTILTDPFEVKPAHGFKKPFPPTPLERTLDRQGKQILL
jgi:hypothetical protein